MSNLNVLPESEQPVMTPEMYAEEREGFIFALEIHQNIIAKQDQEIKALKIENQVLENLLLKIKKV